MELKQNRLLAERPVPRDGFVRHGRVDGASEPGNPVRPARSVRVNLAESPLGWLKARGQISDRQYRAGTQLREDWERAQLGPRVTMQWGAPPIGKTRRAAHEHPDPTMTQIAAKQRFGEAVDAAGPGLSDILWRVVCAGEGMRGAEAALGWPARAGKLVLSLALDRVADYYRLG